jgi:hypothetical protein
MAPGPLLAWWEGCMDQALMASAVRSEPRLRDTADKAETAGKADTAGRADGLPATPSDLSGHRFDDEDYPAYSMGRAAEILGVTPAFLRNLGAAKLIEPQRSEGGHRRFPYERVGVTGRGAAERVEGVGAHARMLADRERGGLRDEWLAIVQQREQRGHRNGGSERGCQLGGASADRRVGIEGRGAPGRGRAATHRGAREHCQMHRRAERRRSHARVGIRTRELIELVALRGGDRSAVAECRGLHCSFDRGSPRHGAAPVIGRPRS